MSVDTERHLEDVRRLARNIAQRATEIAEGRVADPPYAATLLLAEAKTLNAWCSGSRTDFREAQHDATDS